MESTAKISKLSQESVIKDTPMESGTSSSASRIEMSPDRSQERSPKSGKSSHKTKSSYKMYERREVHVTSRVITKGYVSSHSESAVACKRPSDSSSDSKTVSKKPKENLPQSGDKNPSDAKEATQMSGVSSKESGGTKESTVLFKKPRDIPSESKDVTQKSEWSSSEARMESVLVSPSGSSARPKSVVVAPGTSVTKSKSVVVSHEGKLKSMVVAPETSLLKPRSVLVSPGRSGTPKNEHKTYVVTTGSSGLNSVNSLKASGSEDKASCSGVQDTGSGVQASGSESKAAGTEDSGASFKATSVEGSAIKSSSIKVSDGQTLDSIINAKPLRPKVRATQEPISGIETCCSVLLSLEKLQDDSVQPSTSNAPQASKTEKILIAADVEGKFDLFFPKIKKIDRKIGGISFVLCIGDFFGLNSQKSWEPYFEGQKRVPLDTYILGPVNSNQVKHYPKARKNAKMIEMANKVYFLGKSGVFTTKTGLNVAYLSGMESTKSTSYTYNDEDVNDLIVMLTDPANNILPIDIFIASQWPTNIASDYPTKNSSALLQMVVKALVPRYVFSGTEGIWYKRNPYFNEYPYEYVYTRFIGLGKFESNQKSIFAVELKKDIDRVKVKKLDESPFKNIIIYPGHADYRWDAKAMLDEANNTDEGADDDSSADSEDNRDVLEHEGGKKSHQSIKEICWFCLSSPDFEDYYMLHLANHSYVARAKGGLLVDHLVIATVNHVKSYEKLTPEVKDEVNHLKVIVRSYYKDKACCPVFFERNMKSSVHFIMDAVPIQLSHASDVKGVFIEYAERYNLTIKWFPNFDSLVVPKEDGSQYFWAELPNREVLYIPIQRGFPAFFGRMVLADPKLLNKPTKINWRLGVRSVSKETKYTQACREDLATCI